MKKLLCVFLCVLLLGGCGKKNPKEAENESLDFGGFESIVRTTVNDVDVSAKAVYTPFESLRLKFLTPQTVKDTEIICESGEYSITAYGLTFALSGDKMPFSMLCKVLEDCLDKVRGAEPAAEGGSAVYTYNSNGSVYKLYADSQTKAFEKLTADGTDVLFFENFEFSQ